MFSRRHPFLFFTLVLSCISAVFFIFISSLIMGGTLLVNSKLDSTGLSLKKYGNVGIVEIIGTIVSCEEVIDNIKRFRENNSIKAIVLRIDSPGGSVGPSQEIYREIIKTKKIKKVIASLGAVAASGGYYAASSCDKIVSNPGTITGSIGVIMEYANFQEIVEKIGLRSVVIKSGKYKDIASPLRELEDKERKILQDVVDDIHQQFVKDAANGRKIDQKEMAKLADGRIYTGQKA